MTVKLLIILFIILCICFGGFLFILEHSDVNAMKRKQLVVELKKSGVEDLAVLKAIEKVSRHRFVAEEYQKVAYSDQALPIAQRQTISQPSVVAVMTQALALKSTDRVLEIGTGSGYQSAILAEIVREVYTVEIIPELSTAAQELLTNLGYPNIYYRIGDGHQGWAEEAPFDAIMVTAALKEIPEELIRQLKMGGRLIAPVGENHKIQNLYLLTKTPEGIFRDKILPVRFVPMVHTK